MVTENYWYNPRAQDITSAFLYCGSDNRCCSGTCPISENNTCSNNHFGVLCGSCPNGMYEWSGRCVYCNNTVQNTLMYTFTFLLTFIGVGIIYIIPPSKDNFFVDLLFIYQISFMFNFSDNNLIQSSLSILSFNTNISISSGCIFPFTSLLKMISSFFIPVAMFVCQILWYIIARIILSLEPRSHLAKKTIRTWLHYFPHLKGGLGNSNIGVMLTILLFCYTPVYNAAVNILSCRQVEGYPPVVWSYPSIQCWVGYHLVFSIIAGVLLVALGLVLPISIYKHVTRHYKGEATEKAVPKPAQIDPYQILYCCYTPGWYWWMPIDLVERSVVSGVPVLIQSRGEYVTTYCVVILLWMFLLIRVFTMPYRSPVDNSVKIVGYTALILLGSFRLQETFLLQQYGLMTSTSNAIVLTILLIPAIALMPLKIFTKLPSRVQHNFTGFIDSKL
ncbi:uncharacterized protein BJ171DRAFT_597609 [Polychytrium aggregatum]|uniref:uncharacterized protein n=1 Tax=Polychytrium aggregatum TaxID=110093 RepID=UPI0022FE8A80|nr:uncharacterized protein BJ171DRAFT_597609 [Polychytrium aggregatum]KAI9206464.1 hypothetical protein BJ171DRAFT_597609 [Polychytrium aggregatum]